MYYIIQSWESISSNQKTWADKLLFSQVSQRIALLLSASGQQCRGLHFRGWLGVKAKREGLKTDAKGLAKLTCLLQNSGWKTILSFWNGPLFGGNIRSFFRVFSGNFREVRCTVTSPILDMNVAASYIIRSQSLTHLHNPQGLFLSTKLGVLVSNVCYFHPDVCGEMIQFDDCAYFSNMGWCNHVTRYRFGSSNWKNGLFRVPGLRKTTHPRRVRSSLLFNHIGGPGDPGGCITWYIAGSLV